jgi:hypothetical protein
MRVAIYVNVAAHVTDSECGTEGCDISKAVLRQLGVEARFVA